MPDVTQPANETNTSSESPLGGLVTVFGGSGFLGRHVVQALIGKGYRVRVAVRTPAKADPVVALGPDGSVEAVEASLLDAGAVEKAVAGAQAVVNLVGILFESGSQRFEAVQAKGPASIAAACAAAGITRLVHVSAIGANERSDASYARTKALGEQAVLAAVPEAVVLRPSIVFGPEDQFFNRFADMSKFSPVLPLVGPGTRFQPVYVGDVAQAVDVAIDGTAKPGTIYELGGPKVDTFKGLMERMLGVLGRKRPIAAIPIPIAKLQARVMELLPTPPLTRDQIKMLKVDNVVSSAAEGEGRTLAGLGITPTSLDAILPTYLK